MPIRVVVNYQNTSHRFIKTTKVSLTEGGTAQTELPDSTLGHHVWELPGTIGKTLTLKIEIPDPGSLGKPLLTLTQLLDVVASTGGGVILTPKSPSSPPSDQWNNHFNPRISLQVVGTGQIRRFEINVDLTFLDVTDYYEKRPKQISGQLKDYTNMKQTNPVVQSINLRPPDPPPHYGGKLRLLEFTGGKPVCWAVLIPPAIKVDSKIIHATLFFRPVLPISYANTDDLSLKEMIRYIGDPFAADPSDPDPEDFPFFSQRKSWETTPRCGWEKQISLANKCALFVHPFPHGLLYGVASSRFPELLASICRTVWADKNISTDVFEDLRLGRIAISGFSYGGGEVFQALKASPKKIDDLFLFDPIKLSENQNEVLSWFRLGGKKLRMFGGRSSYDAMFGIAQTLKSSDATINPGNRASWEGPLSVFPFAITCPAIRPTQVLSAITDPKPSHLSARTGMFVGGTNNGDLTLEALNSKGKKISGVVPNCIAGEAAAVTLRLFTLQLIGEITTKVEISDDGVHPIKAFPAGSLKVPILDSQGKKILDKKGDPLPPIYYEAANILKFPVKSQGDLDQNVIAITKWVSGHRHQWAVAGGDDFKLETNRGASFRGYLRQALEGSSFT